VDPAGGSGSDSMTLGICHAERSGRVVLDLLVERRPPFSPEQVVQEFVEVLKEYRLSMIHGDRYAGDWPAEQFRKRGVLYKASELSKSELYVQVLPLLNAGNVELLDVPRLIAQFSDLERRVARGTGREIVDHGPGGHDDLCNAAAGAILLARPGGRRIARVLGDRMDPSASFWNTNAPAGVTVRRHGRILT
jgi:hypothetical protein